MNKILRFLLGLVTGIAALFTLSLAPWMMAYESFTWASVSGAMAVGFALFGALLIWAGWRLMRPTIAVDGPPTRQS